MAETVLETLVVAVRADTRALTPDLERVRNSLSGLKAAAQSGREGFAGLGGAVTDFGSALDAGAAAAMDRLETSLVNFARTGKLSFGSLRDVALSVLADIAAAAIRTNLNAVFGSGGSGLGNVLGSGFPALSFGLPGRATGGPVEAGRGYVVGERGPELFVPGQSGRVHAAGVERGGRPVNVTVNVQTPASDAITMQRSANQVAVAVRQALTKAGRYA
jgi:phage-related minor tail protein